MNVDPHPGKASGGYMDGAAYDVHPYLLLNHNDDYPSLSTIAHEWGHAVHTLLCTMHSRSKRRAIRPSSPNRPRSATRCC